MRGQLQATRRWTRASYGGGECAMRRLRQRARAGERRGRKQTALADDEAQMAPKYFFALALNSSAVAAVGAADEDEDAPAPLGNGGGGGLAPPDWGGGGGGTFLTPAAGAEPFATGRVFFTPAGLRNSFFGASFFGGGATLRACTTPGQKQEHSQIANPSALLVAAALALSLRRQWTYTSTFLCSSCFRLNGLMGPPAAVGAVEPGIGMPSGPTW